MSVVYVCLTTSVSLYVHVLKHIFIICDSHTGRKRIHHSYDYVFCILSAIGTQMLGSNISIKH